MLLFSLFRYLTLHAKNSKIVLKSESPAAKVIYSEISLRRTHHKAYTYKEDKEFAQTLWLSGHSLLRLIIIKRTLLQRGHLFWFRRCPLERDFTVVSNVND